jgi:hypothetical protein
VDADQCPDDLDCLPSDPSFWSLPGAAGNLRLEPAGGVTRVTWDAPSFTGGLSVHFDALRSSSPGDFHGPADCLESDGTDHVARDFDDPPPPGEPFYYLVRVENGCPGPGAMGADSGGQPRDGRVCP